MLRGWPNSYFCPLCYRNLETAFHLVAECPFSKQVWTVIANWANCPSLSPHNWTGVLDLQYWFRDLTSASTQQRRGLLTLVLLVIRSLWKERNNRIFKHEELTVPRFTALLRDEVRTWIFAGAKHLETIVGSIFQQQQQHSLFSQVSWGRLEMKPEKNKFKVQTH